MLRNFDAANRTVDRALQISPQAIGLWEIKIRLAIAEKGDFSVYEHAWTRVKAFPMSSEQRGIVLSRSQSFTASTQVPASFAAL